MRAMLLLLLVFGCDDAEGSDEPDCTQMECVRAYECAEACNGPTTNNGCCPCPAGQLDVMVDCPRCEDGCSVVCEGTQCECSCPEPEAASPEQPTDRPCSVDEECQGVPDCDCECAPRLRTAPVPDVERRTMCDGHPPPSCGVQSPCAELHPRCDEGVCVMGPAE